MPTVSDQIETYAMLAREMSPYPVAIRTLDLGSERTCGGIDLSGQQNPSMGLRGIRLSLVKKEMFAGQIEAILRAGKAGKVEIVLPMVASIEEVREAQKVISRLRDSIGGAAAHVPVGVMVEVPAAVIALESLARAVDFLCVGTNDLIQYLLAVDRGNPRVAHLFQPPHPAMLHSLRRIASVAADLNRPVRICGEMSANPFFAVLLIGMGFTELSMNSVSIPVIRRIVGDLNMASAACMAARVMDFQTAAETAQYVVGEVSRLVTLDLAPYVREVVSAELPDTRARPVSAGIH